MKIKFYETNKKNCFTLKSDRINKNMIDYPIGKKFEKVEISECGIADTEECDNVKKFFENLKKSIVNSMYSDKTKIIIHELLDDCEPSTIFGHLLDSNWKPDFELESDQFNEEMIKSPLGKKIGLVEFEGKFLSPTEVRDMIEFLENLQPQLSYDSINEEWEKMKQDFSFI